MQDLTKNKKASTSVGTAAKGAMIGFIVLIMLLTIAGDQMTSGSSLRTSLSNICDSGVPFASFFNSTSGIVLLAIMGALVVFAVVYAFKMFKAGGK